MSTWRGMHTDEVKRSNEKNIKEKRYRMYKGHSPRSFRQRMIWTRTLMQLRQARTKVVSHTEVLEKFMPLVGTERHTHEISSRGSKVMIEMSDIEHDVIQIKSDLEKYLAKGFDPAPVKIAFADYNTAMHDYRSCIERIKAVYHTRVENSGLSSISVSSKFLLVSGSPEDYTFGDCNAFDINYAGAKQSSPFAMMFEQTTTIKTPQVKTTSMTTVKKKTSSDHSSKLVESKGSQNSTIQTKQKTSFSKNLNVESEEKQISSDILMKTNGDQFDSLENNKVNGVQNNKKSEAYIVKNEPLKISKTGNNIEKFVYHHLQERKDNHICQKCEVPNCVIT